MRRRSRKRLVIEMTTGGFHESFGHPVVDPADLITGTGETVELEMEERGSLDQMLREGTTQTKQPAGGKKSSMR